MVVSNELVVKAQNLAKHKLISSHYYRELNMTERHGADRISITRLNK